MRGGLLIVALLGACAPPTPPVVEPPTPVLLQGPSLAVELPDGPVETGALVRVVATGTDPDGVDALELHVRTEGELPFQLVPMERVEDHWEATVPAERVVAPGIELWVRGFDASDWRVPSTWPADGASVPSRIEVLPVSRSVPLEESFEGTFSELYGVYELGWNDATLGFRGQRWRLGGEGFSGEAMALHQGGFAGIEAVDDWLISPSISLEDLVSAEVRWMERGEDVELARHSLWLSTGSPDPTAGDFVQVAELAPPPEGRWGAAPVIDLGPFLGERVVLAWRYEGGHTDEWSIDDVRIRSFAPDVRVVSVVDPFLRPGDTEALRVTVENRGAPTLMPVLLEAAPLDGLVGFNQPVDLGLFATGEQRTVELPLAVALQQPDNAVVQTELTLSDGTLVSRWQHGLQIGFPSTALLRVQTTGLGSLDLRVGTGDPREPHVERVVYQGTLAPGVHSFSVDLGPYGEFLPSVPGRLRWWTRATSASPSRLMGFGISFDGQEEWSEATGPFDAQSLYYLPHRPALVVTSVEVVDPPLRPGESGQIRVGMRNEGGSTEGMVQLWPRSDHADLFVPTVMMEQSPWLAGEDASLEVPVQVSVSHTDSSAVELIVDVVDGVETFQVPVSVPVPWPSLAAGAVFVGGDGVFDPDETTDVLFTVRNDGELATGPLSCSLISTSANAAVVSGPTSLELAPGDFLLAPATLSAVGGAPGDILAFSLTCTGELASWTVPLSVDLGGVPWIVLPLDPAGDALPGAAFDFREARWRYEAGLLTLELTMAGAIGSDPMLELWMVNPGSTYWNHVVTVSSAGAELYGVRQSGWALLSEPTVTIDGNKLALVMAEAEMDLTNTELSIALGTGFCGAAGFHCDQWPDGWGNPYVPPVDTSMWPVLDW